MPADADDTDRRIRDAMLEAMREQGLTQVGLARRLDVSSPYINQVLSGKRGVMRVGLLRVLDALGLKLVVVPKDQ